MSVSLSDLLGEIDVIMNQIYPGSAVELIRRTKDSVYMIYVLSLVIKAIEELFPGSVRVMSINGINPRKLIFRGSPGTIYSNRHNYCYICCNCNNEEFEIHTCVKYTGSSGASHEFDISFIDKEEAVKARTKNKNPSKIRGVIECKFYGSHLNISLIRDFQGAILDFGFRSIMVKRFVSNRGSRSIRLYCRKKSERPHFHFHLLPSNRSEEQLFKSGVKDSIRKWIG